MLDFASEAIVASPSKELSMHYFAFTRVIRFTIPGFACELPQKKVIYVIFVHIKSNPSYWCTGQLKLLKNDHDYVSI